MKTMRFLRMGLVATALASALAACSDAPTGAAPESIDTTLARQVAALGFRADMIEDHGDFVLVEGDIYLSKAQLRTVPLVYGRDPLSPKFQYRTTNLVTSANVRDIVVDLSGLSSQTAWQTAARDAMMHWNGTGSNVQMTEGTSAVDITVSTTCTSFDVAAYALFPSGGNSGPTIYVNTCFGYSTTSAQKVHNMVHELGHTIGFRHSNYTQLGETSGTDGAVQVPGTPSSGNASGSVMNGGTALNSWAGFASSDLTATRTLYPLPSPSPVVSHPFTNALLSWPAVAGAGHYQIRRMDKWMTYNGYEDRRSEYLNTGDWFDVYTESYDTGTTWTGTSNCYLWSGYDETWTDGWYEVRAVFSNGTSSAAYVGSEDLTC